MSSIRHPAPWTRWGIKYAEKKLRTPLPRRRIRLMLFWAIERYSRLGSTSKLYSVVQGKSASTSGASSGKPTHHKRPRDASSKEIPGNRHGKSSNSLHRS